MLRKILSLMFSTNVTALLLTPPMMFLSASALGQSDTEHLLEQEQAKSRWSLDLGVDYTSQYFFRGIIQETDGAIIQPWAEAGVRLLENDSISISGFFGIWNSFHSETSTAGVADGAIEHWYEADLYAGLSLVADNFTLGVAYVYYTSPSSAFSTIQEILLSLEYDDSDLLGAFSLSPSVALAIETGSNGADGAGGKNGVYLQLGVAPGFSTQITDSGRTIDFSFPVTVGLSLSDYFEDAVGNDDFFGYLDIGAEASIELPAPDDWGAWALTARVHVLLLGDNTRDFNGGDDFEVIASVGVEVSY